MTFTHISILHAKIRSALHWKGNFRQPPCHGFWDMGLPRRYTKPGQECGALLPNYTQICANTSHMKENIILYNSEVMHLKLFLQVSNTA